MSALQDAEPSSEPAAKKTKGLKSPAIKAEKPKADAAEAAFDDALKKAAKVTDLTSPQLLQDTAAVCCPNDRLVVMTTSRRLPAAHQPILNFFSYR